MDSLSSLQMTNSTDYARKILRLKYLVQLIDLFLLTEDVTHE